VHASHIPERCGLFTLIVLGETVLAVVLGTESVSWTLESGLVAALGFTIGASFWWLYFAFVDSARMRRVHFLYVYAHLPLLAGLTAVGVGVKLAITEAGGPDLSNGARWILCAGIALAFGAIVALQLATTHRGRERDAWLRGGTPALALALAIAGGGLDPMVVLGVLALALASQVVLEVVDREREQQAV
jgi:low temperature requirement protein LtrA